MPLIVLVISLQLSVASHGFQRRRNEPKTKQCEKCLACLINIQRQTEQSSVGCRVLHISIEKYALSLVTICYFLVKDTQNTSAASWRESETITAQNIKNNNYTYTSKGGDSVSNEAKR